MIEAARRRFPDIRFDVGDAEDLPYPDGRFDAVLSNIVLFHVTDPDRAMAEAFRVLTRGGRFVFSQWLGPDVSECYRMLFDVLSAHADLSRADPAPDAYALSDRSNVAAKMQRAGFGDIAFEEVQNVLHAEGPSFFDFFMTFGVRVPLIVERQDETTQQIIREEIDKRAAAYFSDGLYKIPIPSLIVSGIRPAD